MKNQILKVVSEAEDRIGKIHTFVISEQEKYEIVDEIHRETLKKIEEILFPNPRYYD